MEVIRVTATKFMPVLLAISLLFIFGCTNEEKAEETIIPLQPSETATIEINQAVEVFPYPIPTSVLPVAPSPTEAIATASPFRANVPFETQLRILLWHSLNELQTRGLAEVIAAFQESNPDIRIEEVFYPHDDLKSKFEQAARSGDGPAVLLAPQDWIPDLYDRGLVEDLSDQVDERLLKSLAPIGLTGSRFKGALPALPYRLEGVVLFRNQSVISEPAVTLEEFISQAVVATSGGTIGAYLDLGSYFSLPHLTACGGQIMDMNGLPAFIDPSGVCWLELLRSFKDAGLPWVINSQDDAELFKAGRVGMIIDEISKAREFSEAIGEENLAIDPWPNTAQGHLSGFVRSWVVMMRSGMEDEEEKASWVFMKFLLSPETQSFLADPEFDGFIPSVEGVEISDRIIAEAFLAFQRGTAFPLLPMEAYWDAVDRAIRVAMEDGVDETLILEKAKERILRGIED